MPKSDDESPRLSWIVAFLCVEKFKGFRQAAKFLETTQPQISRRVADLERWFGSDLFVRTRPPALTDFGKGFLPQAQRFVGFMYMRQDGKHLPVPADPTPREREKAKALWALTQEI